MQLKLKTFSHYQKSILYIHQLLVKLTQLYNNLIQLKCLHFYLEQLNKLYKTVKQDNIKYFIDLQVARIYQHILDRKLEIDDTMYSVIIPITIQYVNSFTHLNATSLGQIAICSARLQLQHDGLWQALMNKLDQGNLYRHLTLTQTVDLLHALVSNGKFVNHPLINKLSNVVAQQKAYYQNYPKFLNMIRQSNKILQEKGEKTLKITQAYQQIA